MSVRAYSLFILTSCTLYAVNWHARPMNFFFVKITLAILRQLDREFKFTAVQSYRYSSTPISFALLPYTAVSFLAERPAVISGVETIDNFGFEDGELSFNPQATKEKDKVVCANQDLCRSSFAVLLAFLLLFFDPTNSMVSGRVNRSVVESTGQ